MNQRIVDNRSIEAGAMQVGIVGLGLIGGSMAIDLRQQAQVKVLGMSRRPETCEQAIARGVVDAASPEPSVMANADVVVICTPLNAIEPTVKALIPHLKSTAILTDVGSVKAPVVEAIAPLWPRFVGGHPMAGTTESGLDAALSGLFVNRPYVLTPIDSTPSDAIQTVATLARSLGSTLYQCPPDAHDHAVAWISHLPVMVSASLISACTGESDPTVLHLAQELASSGFRDTSRVGGGNPELGLMMATYNREALLRSLQVYRATLDEVIHQIEQQQWPKLDALLHQTHAARPNFVD